MTQLIRAFASNPPPPLPVLSRQPSRHRQTRPTTILNHLVPHPTPVPPRSLLPNPDEPLPPLPHLQSSPSPRTTTANICHVRPPLSVTFNTSSLSGGVWRRCAQLLRTLRSKRELYSNDIWQMRYPRSFSTLARPGRAPVSLEKIPQSLLYHHITAT